MNDTEQRNFFRYKKELKKTKKMLMQIQHLLLENQQLKRELDTLRTYYQDLTEKVIYSDELRGVLKDAESQNASGVKITCGKL